MLKKRYDSIQFENFDLRNKDYLDNLVYANTLSQKIEDYYNSDDNNTPLYVAVTGSWGSGKTTVVNTAIEMLKEKVDVKQFVYDAWKYEGDSFRRTFTKCILDGSGLDSKSKKYKAYYNRMYNDKSIETESLTEIFKLAKETSTEFNNKWLIFLPVVLILCLLIVQWLTSIEVFKLIIKGAIWIVGLFSAALIISSLVKFYGKYMTARVTYVFQKLFSPEQFYDTVNELLSDVKGNKLILIDNIDRCDKVELKNTISSIKGFFNEKDKVVYIIPFDLQQMKSAYGDDYNSYSEKVFNFVVDLKEKSAKNIIDFMDKLLNNEEEYKELFINSTISIIASSECKTPRQILNICNDYITEYNIFIEKNNLDPAEVDDDDLAYLMKYTIIKRFYNDFFRRMHLNIEYIKNIESSIKARIQYEDLKKDFPWLGQEEYTFLRKINSIIPTNYNYFYSSQSNDDFEIDDETRNLIDSEEFEKINDIISSSDTQKELICKYLSSSLKYDLVREVWKPNILSKFKLILFLMKSNTITSDEFHQYFKFIITDEFMRHIIYSLEIGVKDVVFFVNTISELNKRKSYIPKVLNELTSGRMRIEETNKIETITTLISGLNISKPDENLVEYINRHFNNMVDNHFYSNDDNYNMLTSDVMRYVNDVNIIRLLDSFNINELKYLFTISDLIDDRCSALNNNDLFNAYIRLINRLDKSLFEVDHFEKIYSTLNTLKDKGEYKQFINGLSISTIPDAKASNNLIDTVYELYKNTNFNNLGNILSSFNTLELRSYVLNDIKIDESVSDQIIEIAKRIISILDDGQFDENLKNIVDIYENSNDGFRSWFNRIITSNRISKLDVFYENLNDHVHKDTLANIVTSTPFNFNEKINMIKYFMTSHERFGLLINNENNLSNLEVIVNAADKHYQSLAVDRIINVIDGKTNIIGEDVNCIIRMIENDLLNVKSQKQILSSIINQKTNLDDLNRIFNVLSPGLKGISKEYNTIRAILVEHNLIEDQNIEKVNQ